MICSFGRLPSFRAVFAALALPTLLGACATLARRDATVAAVAGEWVDVSKSTRADTMVWVLAGNGDDELLRVSPAAEGARLTRRHFGRWYPSARASDGDETLCFVQRPGRDAPSCVDFTIDTVIVRDRPLRRLTLHGYAGEHHTSDRRLLERVPRAAPAARAEAAESTASSASAGTFQPRAVQPERPSVATHAGTVAPGFAEVETGFERDRSTDGTTLGSVPTVLKLGMTRRTQLSVQLPVLGGTDLRSGLGDAAVGVKWRIFEDDPVLQDIALLPQLKLSSGGARGSGTTDVSLLLINSRTIGPVGVDVNAGVTRRSGDGSQAPRSATMWAVAAGIPVRGAMGWALEGYGYPGTGGAAGAPPTVAILTGPTLVPRPELELDVGVIIPVVGSPPRGIYAGFVTNVGKLPRF